MKYGIFSDIHGDINLLERLFNKFDEEEIKGVCLGDIVHNGETYNEKRCVDLVKENGCYAIKGNHDNEVVKLYTQSCKSRLSTEDIRYLKILPRLIQIGDIMLVHNSSDIDNDFNVKKEFNALRLSDCKVGFFGHGHKRSAYRNGNVIDLVNAKLSLNHGLYLINPGALWKEGLYGVYDLDNNLFDFKQLS